MSDVEHDNSLLAAAASQLASYLATPGLPPRVELLCLAAAAQLPRGPHTPPLSTGSTAIAGPDQILQTLSELSSDRRATEPVLDAIAHLNAAADALRVT